MTSEEIHDALSKVADELREVQTEETDFEIEDDHIGIFIDFQNEEDRQTVTSSLNRNDLFYHDWS